MRKVNDFKTLKVGNTFLFIKNINGFTPKNQEIKWFGIVTDKDDCGFRCNYFALWNDREETDKIINGHFEYNLAYGKEWNWWIYKLTKEEARPHIDKMVMLAI